MQRNVKMRLLRCRERADIEEARDGGYDHPAGKTGCVSLQDIHVAEQEIAHHDEQVLPAKRQTNAFAVESIHFGERIVAILWLDEESLARDAVIKPFAFADRQHDEREFRQAGRCARCACDNGQGRLSRLTAHRRFLVRRPDEKIAFQVRP